MTTVAHLIDQTFRTYLEPPDAQPAAARLNGAIDDSTTTVVLTGWEVAEDAELVRVGVLLEADAELMRVTSFDSTIQTATVVRGVDGTTAATHADQARVKLAPRWPRQSVFEEVRNNIVRLYPRLWTTTTEYLSETSPGTYPVSDDLIVEVVEAVPPSSRINVHGRIVESRLEAGGRAFIINTSGIGELVTRMRRRFGVATSEADELADLGMETVWEPLVTAGAAATLLAGRDIPATHTEWVQSTLQAEQIQPGTRVSIAIQIARYRQALLEDFASEMIAEDSNKVGVEMVDPFAQVVR